LFNRRLNVFILFMRKIQALIVISTIFNKFFRLYDLNVLNFALFRYNSRIDSRSEIRFDSGFEPPTLLKAIEKIPYDGKGKVICAPC